MNEVSKERGHTYWEPLWKGGFVGSVMGRMAAFVLMLPIYLIFDILNYGPLTHKKELVYVGLTCLWGSGWATWWSAHKARACENHIKAVVAVGKER